jgi:hypothetical protein
MESRQTVNSAAQPVATESDSSIRSHTDICAGHGGRANAELNRSHAGDDPVEADLAIHFSLDTVAACPSLDLRIGSDRCQLAEHESGAGDQERPPRRG